MLSYFDNEGIMTISNNNANSEIDSNNNSNFIASPKGTKPFPFQKKVRTIARRNKTKLITIPHEICHLLKIEDGTNLNIYCEIENDRIIIEKLS
ncbi:MAG: hypothetical protein R2685_07740 [Candidatus Nitrosocosmicus sp.]|nr:hypothetical protein [Candidatus Nitrosocosmicus sp.]